MIGLMTLIAWASLLSAAWKAWGAWDLYARASDTYGRAAARVLREAGAAELWVGLAFLLLGGIALGVRQALREAEAIAIDCAVERARTMRLGEAPETRRA